MRKVIFLIFFSLSYTLYSFAQSNDIVCTFNYRISGSRIDSNYYDKLKLILHKNSYVKQILFYKKKQVDRRDSFLLILNENYSIYVQKISNEYLNSASIPFFKIKDSIDYVNHATQRIPFLGIEGSITFKGEKEFETTFKKKRKAQEFVIINKKGNIEAITKILLDDTYRLPLFVEIEIFLHWKGGTRKRNSTIFELESID
jgi:hypothetical protein